MVMNVGALRSGDEEAVKQDIHGVAEATHRAGAILKVILETALLDDNQKAVACTLAKLAGAERLPEGIVVVSERRGDGPRPAKSDRVRVKYEGRLVDGSRFDGNDAAEFRLDQVIPCWTQGVQRMQVGGRARLVCPSASAYGDQGRPPQIPGGATLIFEIELLGIAR